MSDEKERNAEDEGCEEKEQTTGWLGDRFMSLKVRTLCKIFLYSVLGPLLLYCVFFGFLHYQQRAVTESTTTTSEKKLVYWIYSKKNDTGHLRHVFTVLDRLGFVRGTNGSDWDLLWAHDYPFRTLYESLSRLRPDQRVNHIPGCGYITNKADLSTTGGRYMPRAFKLPDDRSELMRYAASNPARKFVEKSNDHRGIRLRRIDQMNLTESGTFVQEFIERPFLIDGYKFDIGVYTVLTSVDPLRVYAYKGDVLFRFCPIKYYPMDEHVLDKYVVGDDYLPIWNVPSLKDYYTRLKFSMKDTFDAYVRSLGKDPERVWTNVYEAIKEVALAKEAKMKEVVRRFGTGGNFFELVRFDFTLDEDLNVYTMEANMSPNLSSAHYPPNQLLYEQVIFNLFALVGVGQRVKRDSLRPRDITEEEMEVAYKNLVVLPEICKECSDCFRVECQLCGPCFTPETKLILSQSYMEHQNRMDFLRVFPPPITKDMVLKDYTLRNQLLVRWYQGKCELDRTWCTG